MVDEEALPRARRSHRTCPSGVKHASGSDTRAARDEKRWMRQEFGSLEF